MLQDLRFTFRLLLKERWYTAVAVIALGMGIGVNAIAFTIVHAAMLRSLPFTDPGRIYLLSLQHRQDYLVGVSHAELQDLRAQGRTFSAIAAYTTGSFNISDDRALPDQARGAHITANAFHVLGSSPTLGRDFTPEDERAAAERVVLIGERLWKNRYNADRHVLGQTLRIDGQPATIVGVVPDSMRFPENAELWQPIAPPDGPEQRDKRPLAAFGRLRDGASFNEAQAEMNGIAQQLAAAYPDTNKDLTRARVETITQRFVGGGARVVFLSMMGAVSFVLLIACANVANLLLSRSAHRAREIAVRMALGATRVRILRQLLIESIVLGCLGGGLGLAITLIGVPLFDAAVQDPGKPYWIVFAVDYAVFGYVAGICVLTGILFGLAPALHVSKTNINDVLNEGGRGNSGGKRARWISGSLVVAELSLTMILLVGAGLMVRSFLALYALNIGIETDHLMSMRLQLPAARYAKVEERRAFYERLEPRIAAVAGVEAVALTTSVPPLGTGGRPIEIEGRPARAAGESAPIVDVVTISPSFFDVVRAPMLRGRAFHEMDGAPGARHAIINERLAVLFFPGEDALGKRIRFVSQAPPPKPAGTSESAPAPAAPEWATIVGISRTIRHSAPRDARMNPVMYLPMRQDTPSSAALLVRSHLPPSSVMDAVRREVQTVDRDQPIFTFKTLDQALSDARWPQRVFGTLFVIFALIALVLSSVGLYAVMAYSVTQQTREIGLRMALGAEARQVSWMVLRRGLVQLAIGLTLGLVGAYAVSGVLRRALVQVTPTDPITFAAITVLLTIVALCACVLPARRATRVDPLVALRD